MSTQQLPTADDFFGIAQANQPTQDPQVPAALPSADEFFAPPSTMDRIKFATFPSLLSEDKRREMYIREAQSTQRIMSAFATSAQEGFGDTPIDTLTPEQESFLKTMGWAQDESGYHLQKAFAEGVMRPLVTDMNMAWRGLMGAVGGFEGGVNQLGVETVGVGDIGTSIVHAPEAFGASLFGEFAGLPRVLSRTEVVGSRSIGVIGEGERGYYDVGELTPENAQARVQAAHEIGEVPQQPLPATTDVHVIARRVDPQTFEKFDALEAQKAVHRETLDELGLEREASPEVVQAQRDMDEILSKVHGVQERLTKAQTARLEEAQARLDAALTLDTPEMAVSRQALLAADIAQREMVPDVAAAYRQAREMLPEQDINQIDELQAASRGSNIAKEGPPKAEPEAPKPTPLFEPVDKTVPAPVEQPVVMGEGAEATRLATEGLVPTQRTTTALRPIEGTGETQVRTLAEGVEAKAIQNRLVEDFGDLPEYHEVSMADQAERAVAIVNKDYESAKQIAMGYKQPPKNIIPESVFNAVERRAMQEGDVGFLQELATKSRLVTAATTMGQRLRTLRERNPLSFTAAIREIQEAWRAVAHDAETTVKTELSNIKREIKRQTPSRETWDTFIKAIQCAE